METMIVGLALLISAYILLAALIDRAQRPWKVRVSVHVCGFCDDPDGDEDDLEPDTEPAAKKKARADVGVN